MSSGKTPRPRPYWHVDAKWFTGIVLFVLLNLTFLLFVLVQLTAPDQGISLLTLTLASSFSAESGGLDEEGDIEIMRQKIAESPDGEWQPIPGMRLFVREEDIAGKTPREARLWFFRQWAEPLYYDGAKGLAGLMTDAEMQQSVESGVGPLGLVSAETHRKLLVAFTVAGLISLFFLGCLIVFSYGFGRVGSPGCVIFLAAAPGFILLGGMSGWLERSSQGPITEGELSAVARYTQLAVDVLPDIVAMATRIHLILISLGIGLMVLALMGTLLVRGRRRNQPLS